MAKPTPEPRARTPVQPARIELDARHVLYLDEHMLVVSKPAGALSDATRDPARDHMVAAARRWLAGRGEHERGEHERGEHERGEHLDARDMDVRAVHRLDRDTSGVLVLARTRAAAAALSAELAGRRVVKRYVAVVAAGGRDHPIPAAWTVADYLAHRKGRTIRVRSGGDRAETRFVLGERGPDWAWIEAHPITGRTHQIRVHAAESGLPILGDPLYAPPPVRARAPRLMLHAASLAIAHPHSGVTLCFEAPLPADMRALPASPAPAREDGH